MEFDKTMNFKVEREENTKLSEKRSIAQNLNWRYCLLFQKDYTINMKK